LRPVTGVEVVIGKCLAVYLAPLRRYGASKIIGSRLWPFRVTWRHRSRDHSTRVGRLSMGHRYRDMAVWSSSKEALPGTEVNRWSVVGRSVGPQCVHVMSLISYTPLRYVRNVAREE